MADRYLNLVIVRSYENLFDDACVEQSIGVTLASAFVKATSGALICAKVGTNTQTVLATNMSSRNLVALAAASPSVAAITYYYPY
eukprot:SAG31_NODE_12163_length_962_cov_9.566628_1_plen_85_part_00